MTKGFLFIDKGTVRVVVLQFVFCCLLAVPTYGQIPIFDTDSSTIISDELRPPRGLADSPRENYANVRLTFDGASSEHPKAVVDANFLYVVWEDKRDSGPDAEVYWQRFDKNGMPLTSPIRISDTDDHSLDPGIGVDGLGNSYIVWQEGSPWGTIYATKVDSDGNVLIGPLAVSSNLSMDPEISVLPSGHNAIVYHRRAATDQNAYVRQGDENLAQICLKGLNDGTLPAFEKQPAVTLAANGTALVAWYDLSQFFQDGIYIAGVANPGCQLTDFRRHANGEYGDCDVGYSGSFPWIVCGHGGNVYNLHGTSGITRVNDVAGTAVNPRVADDPSLAYVVWQDSRDGNSEIYLSPAYGSNSYPDIRLTNDPNSSTNPDIASRTAVAGEWWVVFQDNRAGNPEIYLTGSGVETNCNSGIDADSDGIDDGCDNCVNVHPVVSNTGPYQLSLSTYWSYSPQITDPDDTDHSIEFLNLPYWLSADGDSVFGTSSDSLITSESFSVVVSDSCNVDSLQLEVSVRNCGDVDGDGRISLGDAVCLLNWIFNIGCSSFHAGTVADVSCDHKANIGDCVYLVNYIFAGGPAPCALCEQ